ncbi:hypothetical protein GYM62_06510 [Algoriphagus sp. NBT04N3]|jgi:signal transduction histidine kinase|uniref:ATP-binding protein n=1 Tax=Algoriphagus sp. NBT04N3 TaxID=2705473 RepID=UPI001C635D40|nr:ATP-binding protein [Algoriphagus sp. NBT04N3]QYH38467.1 hypothetical protein GYM62_06510 [Algoriphagus sp. NBT04N3]
MQFRTKARAVDLLGKGQIADLPTAISELWKNGYDAYGDNLESALYMPNYYGYPDPVFVLSDDGKGMDNNDIVERWFVLGTDSKSRGIEDSIGPETLNKPSRVKMGEKGIGRLAVAYLGPQMLMLTKKRGKPLEVVFFDWRILDNYNLFLSDINIPVRSVDSIDSFFKVFQDLKEEFLTNFPKIKIGQKDPWEDQKKLKEEIIKECNQLNVPNFILEDWISDLLINPAQSHATRFIIFQPDQQLVELKNFIKKDDNNDDISFAHTVATLLGLFNLFKTNEPEHKTHFWIYEDENRERYDLLTYRSFFTPDDFELCDHLIDGQFDDHGEFSGTVRIYKKTIPHNFKPQKKIGKSSYGPFNVKIGYINSIAEESMLNPELKRAFEDKLELYSGLFIYRDGFRVLPYGRPDTDFLEFEERRSKGAGTYFFTKRRMFGYLEITRKDNGKLKDKSSREGFINNQAFRDFKTDLIAFFKDLAKKYFATKAEYDYKRDQQDDLKERAEAEHQEQERDKEARKSFANELKEKPKQLEELKNKYNSLLEELSKKSSQTNIIYEEIQGLIEKIEECKVKIYNYKINKPARFKPTELQNKKFREYSKSFALTLKQLDKSEEVLFPIRDKLKIHELFKEFEDKSTYYQNTLSRYYQDYDTQLNQAFEKIREEFNSEKLVFLNDFNEKFEAIIPNRTDAIEITRSMKILENIFKDSQERIQKRIDPYLEHLNRLSFDVNEDNLVGYYKEKFVEMKEEWNKTYELAQLGIAVEIIDHQFNTLYAQMAEGIKKMAPHLNDGHEPERVYRNLSTAFEHLQDNYKLLQPLYRTTGRIRKEITGLELKEYAEDFFGSRINENSISLTISESGKKWSTISYESIFKPVLINIINNAIYWLRRAENKEIKIDAEKEKLLIMNSGEPIDDYNLKDIFKLFYSDRPKGRGIGLYLAKQSLNGIGYDIEATNDPKYNHLNGACFIIKPI